MSQHIEEKSNAFVLNGYMMLFAFVACSVFFAWLTYSGFTGTGNYRLITLGVCGVLFGLFGLSGIYMLEPNQAINFNLFGTYTGSDRNSGLNWTNPFYGVEKFSLRKNTLLIQPIKVNDKRGNPVEIGAAIVWTIDNPAQVQFGLNMEAEKFVSVQSDVALRNLASKYPYDHLGDNSDVSSEDTLRESSDKIMSEFVKELVEIMKPAGVNVSEAKITHLAYAQEIAGVMLKRQQAEAIIAARKKIVHGAVEIVYDALQQLELKNIIFSDAQKAPLVGNLLTVLCSEQGTQAVISVDRQG